MEKNEQIKLTLQETKARRILQKIRILKLKINEKSLNKTSKERLKMFFVEAKWIYNHILNLSQDGQKPWEINSKNIKSVQVKNKNGEFEERTLNFLQAKPKQDLVKVICQSIYGLSQAKKKGNSIGRLKFKSEYTCIELSQPNPKTAPLIRTKNKIKLVGIKQLLKVHGLNQFNPEWEIANAKLMKKPSGYYLYVTCYENIDLRKIKEKTGKEIGLDFGIKNHITDSNGNVYNCTIEESERLKRLQRKLSRQKKGSNNRYKTIQKIRKEYEKMSNKKKDAANKVVFTLCSQNDMIYIQDENLAGWKEDKRFSSKVHHSFMGLVKAKLLKRENVYVHDRYFPSTKVCYVCGCIQDDIELKDRIFECKDCGHKEDRDIKAAKTMMVVGQLRNKFIPRDAREVKLVEKNIGSSMKQEDAQSLVEH